MRDTSKKGSGSLAIFRPHILSTHIIAIRLFQYLSNLIMLHSILFIIILIPSTFLHLDYYDNLPPISSFLG